MDFLQLSEQWNREDRQVGFWVVGLGLAVLMLLSWRLQAPLHPVSEGAAMVLLPAILVSSALVGLRLWQQPRRLASLHRRYRQQPEMALSTHRYASDRALRRLSRAKWSWLAVSVLGVLVWWLAESAEQMGFAVGLILVAAFGLLLVSLRESRLADYLASLR
ncbi:hypothetical protein [Ferrimonas marina]|uniref:Uncharacterized protein n=1 Tax=Ferrimonas marina TaxID=299255 RepID=A0A1M5YU14_9GAMM|nr:hypothetical protein [Ferrimonas marina]SHI15348.1 hypothetical protein SAMN02745129_4422 [Ferrimonas marina]